MVKQGGIMSTRKIGIRTYRKVYVEIKSREDETKWKDFFKKYFPNHYAKELLNDDLLIDVEAYHRCHSYETKAIAISPSGYGYISLRLASYGHYPEVKDFEEFKLTACYRTIIAQGVTLEEGTPNFIYIKKNQVWLLKNE